MRAGLLQLRQLRHWLRARAGQAAARPRHVDVNDTNIECDSRAPPSKQTRARACSSGSARVAGTPEVAQAVRWSPKQVEASAAAACAGAERHGKTQPTKQQKPGTARWR